VKHGLDGEIYSGDSWSRSVVPKLGSRLPWESFAIFLEVARTSDKNIHNYFWILYFVYGTTFYPSQDNRITWQKWKPTFSFKTV